LGDSLQRDHSHLARVVRRYRPHKGVFQTETGRFVTRRLVRSYAACGEHAPLLARELARDRRCPMPRALKRQPIPRTSRLCLDCPRMDWGSGAPMGPGRKFLWQWACWASLGARYGSSIARDAVGGNHDTCAARRPFMPVSISSLRESCWESCRAGGHQQESTGHALRGRLHRRYRPTRHGTPVRALGDSLRRTLGESGGTQPLP
jgi:hypothetical protein